MDAGALDRMVRIERPVTAQDSFGEPIVTWTLVATAHAEIVPMRASERFTSQQFLAEVDTRLRLRWRDDVDATMRVVFENTAYDIASVTEIGRREGTEIIARARVLETVT